MSNANYYKDGDWNFSCDLCGAKEKASRGVKTWDGFYVCQWHKEERNPQDFVRGVKDDPSPPWTRPEPTVVYLPMTYSQGAELLNGAPFNTIPLG